MIPGVLLALCWRSLGFGAFECRFFRALVGLRCMGMDRFGLLMEGAGPLVVHIWSFFTFMLI
jgi:hypothetical protein